MSTGLNCELYETIDGTWFYLLQDYSCPVGAWDWREYATAYGPFTTDAVARQHLFEHHANPGGLQTQSYQPGWKPDAVLELAFDAARRRIKQGRR